MKESRVRTQVLALGTKPGGETAARDDGSRRDEASVVVPYERLSQHLPLRIAALFLDGIIVQECGSAEKVLSKLFLPLIHLPVVSQCRTAVVC